MFPAARKYDVRFDGEKNVLFVKDKEVVFTIDLRNGKYLRMKKTGRSKEEWEPITGQIDPEYLEHLDERREKILDAVEKYAQEATNTEKEIKKLLAKHPQLR